MFYPSARSGPESVSGRIPPTGAAWPSPEDRNNNKKKNSNGKE